MTDELKMKIEEFFVPSGRRGDQLLVHRFRSQAATSKGAVMMYPGAVENARIFFTHSGKGLAPFLAREGFDVFACDPRGRGGSKPTIARGINFGQTDIITEDFAALSAAIAAKASQSRQHWLAHSWGGVLMASHLVRFPAQALRVASLTCFGTKRSIAVTGREKYLGVDVVWNRAAPFVAAMCGYLPARALKIGADSETIQTLRDCIEWVDPESPWIDTKDGFDYGSAAQMNKLPRTLHLTGVNDAYLGHATDVARFMEECGLNKKTLRVIGRGNGALHDYDHIDLLTHPDAVNDHFPGVAAWMAEES